MRTYPGIEEGAVFARNPWRAPGTAKVMSPCGWHGGNPIGCPIGMSECTCAPASVMPNFRRVCLSDGIRHVYTHVCYFLEEMCHSGISRVITNNVILPPHMLAYRKNRRPKLAARVPRRGVSIRQRLASNRVSRCSDHSLGRRLRGPCSLGHQSKPRWWVFVQAVQNATRGPGQLDRKLFSANTSPFRRRLSIRAVRQRHHPTGVLQGIFFLYSNHK